MAPYAWEVGTLVRPENYLGVVTFGVYDSRTGNPIGSAQIDLTFYPGGCDWWDPACTPGQNQQYTVYTDATGHASWTLPGNGPSQSISGTVSATGYDAEPFSDAVGGSDWQQNNYWFRIDLVPVTGRAPPGTGPFAFLGAAWADLTNEAGALWGYLTQGNALGTFIVPLLVVGAILVAIILVIAIARAA